MRSSTSSNWFLFHFEQEGTDFQVVESLDCGVHVTGSVTVDSTPGTLRSSLYANRMDGASGRRARHGTSKIAGNGCDVTFGRWYKVRGVTDAYLPADFESQPTLASLPRLPVVDDPVNATDVPPGTEDPGGDGLPVPLARSSASSFIAPTRVRTMKEARLSELLARVVTLSRGPHGPHPCSIRSVPQATMLAFRAS